MASTPVTISAIQDNQIGISVVLTMIGQPHKARMRCATARTAKITAAEQGEITRDHTILLNVDDCMTI